MTKIYVDTNVYLDYLLDRKNVIGRPLGEDAYRIFARVIGGQFQLIISTHVTGELYRHIETGQAMMLFEMMNGHMVGVTYTEEEKTMAKKLNADHWQDALHAIIANRERAEYLVTQNISDFLQYSNLVQPIRPKEI